MQELIEQFVKSKRAASEARSKISKCLSTSGLSVEQVLILSCISNRERTVSDIAHLCGMLTPAVSRSLAAMEEHKIFKRMSGESDYRLCYIQITAHGKKLLARVYEAHESGKKEEKS